ncbi:rab6, putative [Entamoeba dispar SAW760]|uniref:Rab6, putative n=1 Tax=Entamoeba dispar (strain ATCC PRA-260 / SAW760) TaxID=370354 RepID=B0EGT5_ENTDS|nr:rab6, putative [Entamoeba dispar SAW760]EDR26265.1 rab6, putative [Entamoeba dispar SAW760]|eukprot:EDR26265.1 rab6, putative [Entamoeba dispar SAW760]
MELKIFKFSSGEFNPNTASSIGCDVICKKLILDGKQYNVQLWDTAGQEMFRSTTATYFRNRHCILFMFDVTNRESFTHIEDWMKVFYEIQNEDKKTLLVLVGNKNDMITERQISSEDAKGFAKNHNINYFECSAKEFVHVNFFSYLLNLPYRNINIDNIIEFVIRELRLQKMLVETLPKEIERIDEPIVLQKNDSPQIAEQQNGGVCC